MIFEKEFNNYGFENIVAYSGEDISPKILEESFAVSDNFFAAEYQINKSKIREVIAKYGQMCFIIVDKNEKKVIGYSFWLPIKNSVFVDFMKKEEMLLFIEEDYCSGFNEPVVSLFQTGEAFVLGYDLNDLHKALEDIILHKILVLAKRGTKIGYVAIEAVCKYDKNYLVPLMGIERMFKKGNSTFYCDNYRPEKMFARSKISNEISKYYKN